MAILRDGRGRWRYRKTINLLGGGKVRISRTPIFDTKMGVVSGHLSYRPMRQSALLHGGL